MDGTLKSVMEIDQKKEERGEIKHANLSGVELSKVHRLFGMWDLAGDGFVSTSELALALRKFQVTTSYQDTVKESIKILDNFDHDEDGKLNKVEFADFMKNFSDTTEAVFLELLDFMIVTTALVDNTDAEKAYMDKYWWS